MNKFSFVQILGCIFSIIGTFVYFTPFIRNIGIGEVFMGFGCFLEWVVLSRYFLYSQKQSYILRTVEYAFPVIIRATAGIIPYLIGYAMLG